MLVLLAVIIVINLALSRAENVYYITPTPDTPCPGEPCHTLSQFEQYFQNFSSNMTMVFLPGDHTLNYTISISGFNTIGDIYSHSSIFYPHPFLTLLGSPSSLPEVTSRIVCTWPAGFVFSGITELYINALAFISCGHNDSAALSIQTVWSVKISNCLFLNNTNSLPSNSTTSVDRGALLTISENTFLPYAGGALGVYATTSVTLTRNIFRNNCADYGGALLVWWNSTLILMGNTFQNNSADYSGGTFYAYTNNTLTLSENLFQNNSADYGGILYVYTKNTLTLSENTFQNTYANHSGSVLYAYKNNILILAENAFQNNSADYGGALYADTNNTLTLSKNTFQNTHANHSGGAFYAHTNNTLNLSENTFQNNFADYGGAFYAYTNSILTLLENRFQNNYAEYGGALSIYFTTTITLRGNIFQNNHADYGGALDVWWNSTLILIGNTFINNSADYSGGALYAYTSNALTLLQNTFQKNYADCGGSLEAYVNNILTLADNTFQNNSVNHSGGALKAYTNNTLTLSVNTFQGNSAHHGGALDVHINNTLILFKNLFQNNCSASGGAFHADTSNNLTSSENTFRNNCAVIGGDFSVLNNNILTLLVNIFQKNSAYYGSALHAYTTNIVNLSGNTFQNNYAYLGGALLAYTNNTLTLTENTFQNNFASRGGTVYAYLNNTLTLSKNTFHNNSANISGGALYVNINTILNLSQNTFDDNSAGLGGALLVRQSTIHLTNNTLNRNTAQSYGGAIFCFSNSTLGVLGSHRVKNNIAQYGGGIAALECVIVLAGDLLIANNSASFGGGLYVDQSQVSGHANFSNNCATADGGAVYLSGSRLYFKHHITLFRNSALNGGGLLLTEGSELHLQPSTTINFTDNFVGKKGGAIKVEKSNPLSDCAEVSCELLIESSCFFQIEIQTQYYDTQINIYEITELHNVRMYFQNNTALEAGASLYGGSVDNCSLNFINPQPPQSDNLETVYRCPNSGQIFNYIFISEQQDLDISSDPLYICPCEGSNIDCSVSITTRSVYPGGTIELPIIAYGQRNGTTPAVIHVIPNSNIEVDDLETTQSIKNRCTPLTYTVKTHAIGTTQKITLYAEGPCPLQYSLPSRIITVHVSIRKCPPGFELLQFQPECNCVQRLQRFTNAWTLDDGRIQRSGEFWVGYTPNSTSDGLILHPHCPFDYCTSKIMYIAVDDSDEQCSNNRTGLLCGKCGQNFSLALGTNHCLQCSNDYIWLIVVFAFAGVTLVLLLLVLRLTVAVGTINGLAFYVNIFAMNSATFFKPQITNVLTVFIAWLNLDLGIEMCFYDGMDAYTKAWLQFVFPFYVWILVGIIILISHFSSKVATILGTNPIAVLATLFLLSYTKCLHTVIAALSYTLLEYPNNTKTAVWLYDGNIRYLSNKHIPLFIGALVCLIILFLPYTIFLIFGQWLRSKSGQWKIFSWVNHYRILPFLDAYHAPYTDKHRYWTGLMLLVRCILFLLFAFNALGDPSVNLLAIGSVTAVLLIVYALFGNRIYKTWYLNTLELSFIANLCILSLATLYIRSAGGNQNAVTFTSISIAFATFIGIVTYHFIQQIKHTPTLWRKVLPRNGTYELVPQTDEHSDLEDVSPPSPPDPSDGCATVTHINFHELLDLSNDIELREPCMDMDD